MSLSEAQYRLLGHRLLGRMVAREHLPVERYRLSYPALSRLFARGLCLARHTSTSHGWVPTGRGLVEFHNQKPKGPRDEA